MDLPTPLRHACRAVARRPRSTAFGVLILSAGIGVAVTIFAVANGVLLQPLPFSGANRLVTVGLAGRSGQSMPAEVYTYLVEVKDRAFEELGGYVSLFTTTTSTAATRPRTEVLFGTYVTSNLLSMLGVEPTLGRGLLPADGEADAAPAVLLSHGAWQLLFAGADDILGESVIVNGEPATVVGVMPPGFRFPTRQVGVCRGPGSTASCPGSSAISGSRC